MKFLILILVSFLTINYASAANILFYWGVSVYSHRISVWPLVEKLVEKGHNVTFLSPFPPKNPNPFVTEIMVDHLFRDGTHSKGIDFLEVRVTQGSHGIEKLWSRYFDFAIDHCESIFKNPDLVRWINNASYDLVIINTLFNDCAYGLSHKFKAPHIMYGTTSVSWWWSEAYGYPEENYPEFQYHYNLNMNFLQSAWNALRPLYWYWNRNFYMFPKVHEILKKGLNLDDMPSLSEMEQNVSLVLLNRHHTEEYPRALPPLFVEIGGMHCKDEVKPLAQDVKTFLENGDEGFIYFSFGSFANPDNLPKNIRDTIFGAMKKSKTKFLVKWEGNPPQEFPQNAKAVQWISQQDVLAHPGIKGFISHGGLMGTQEAIFHGVPMIVIPLFSDQDFNAEVVSSTKRGIKLEISELTERQLQDAIAEIQNNPIYMENSKKTSRLFKDRPTKPIDMAVWWVEYVLRNNDTSHLRPIGMTKNWYQRRMLDIWGFIVLFACAFIILVTASGYYLIKTFSKSSQKSIVFNKKIN